LDGRLAKRYGCRHLSGVESAIYQTRADEDSALDSGLHPALRAGIASARGKVIEALRQVSFKIPGDSLVVPQLVRLLLDAGSMGEALAIARSCPVRKE